MFTPTDAAFQSAGLSPDNFTELPQPIVENLLLYHTLPGAVTKAVITKDDVLFTALDVALQTSSGALIDSLGGTSKIIEADVACSNGYLHFVDRVLMPPDLLTSLDSYNEVGGPYEGLFDTVLTAIRGTEMDADLSGLKGPFTVRKRLSRRRGWICCGVIHRRRGEFFALFSILQRAPNA